MKNNFFSFFKKLKLELVSYFKRLYKNQDVKKCIEKIINMYTRYLRACEDP